MRVTSNSQPTGTFTVTRGQGSTSGQAFAANATLTPILDATAANAAFVRLDSTSTQAMAAPISVPPSSTLSVPTTSFGSYPVKIDDILVGTDTRYPSATSQITFLNTSGSGTNVLPTAFRHLLLEWYARGDTAATSVSISVRFNNDGAANYDSQYVRGLGATASAVEALGATSILMGEIPAATGTTNYFGQGEARVWHYNGTVGNKLVVANHAASWANTTGTTNSQQTTGKWRTTGTAVTRIDVILSAGNFIVGSLFTLYGIP